MISAKEARELFDNKVDDTLLGFISESIEKCAKNKIREPITFHKYENPYRRNSYGYALNHVYLDGKYDYVFEDFSELSKILIDNGYDVIFENDKFILSW